MSFSVNLYVKYNGIILTVVFNSCLPHVHFTKNNAVDASQVFKALIICHDINICLNFKFQYFA